jgi:membrane protein
MKKRFPADSATGPLSLVHSAWVLLVEAVESFLDDHAIRMAASLAFYATFSIAPALLLALSVAGLFIDGLAAQMELTNKLEELITPDAAAYVFSLLNGLGAQLRGKHLPLAGIGGAILAATAVFVEIHSSMNVIWGVKPKNGYGIIRAVLARAVSFVFVVGVGILLMVSVVATTVLATINAFFASHLAVPQQLLDWLQLSTTFGTIPLMLAFTYKFVPDTDIAWKDVIAGAVVASILFTVGKWIFGMYLKVSILSSVYGAAGSLFVLLAWVYYSAQAFFFGAEVTKVYARRFGSKSEAQVPVTKRPARRKDRTG